MTIQRSFQENIDRAKNLVDIYDRHLAGSGSGRRGVRKTDALRSAVVFLHATLEDFLRSLARERLPWSSDHVLNQIPLIGFEKGEKYQLGALASLRRKRVSQVINESVQAHLDRATFNNTKQVAALLQSLGIDVSAVSRRFDDIQSMMDRRHHIVHRADRNENRGSGQYAARELNRNTVKNWTEAVEEFVTDVLRELKNT